MKFQKIKKRLSSIFFIGSISLLPVLTIGSTSKHEQLNKKNNTQLIESKDKKSVLKKIIKKRKIKQKLNSRESFEINKNRVAAQESQYYKWMISLDYDVVDNGLNNIDKDAEQFTNNNIRYFTMMLEELKDVVSFSYSRLAPIIWIQFKNTETKTENEDYILNSDFVLTINEVDLDQKNNNLTSDNEHNICEECLKKFSSMDLDSKFDIINFLKQKQRENQKITEENADISNNDKSIGAIGILEAQNGIIDINLEAFSNKEVEFFKGKNSKISKHASLVAAIAAGKTGIDRFAKIYSVGFENTFYEDWIKNIEWLIIDKKVSIINHSYSSPPKLEDEYEWDSFFLDYISRKYGIINVFSAGNGHNEKNNVNSLINGTQLSLNSITVGSVDNSRNFNAAEFSNRDKDGTYAQLPKPLVSAPGLDFLIKNNNDSAESGTSFSAPLVSGSISVLLREKQEKLNWENRVSGVQAILAASARDSNAEYFKNKLENGLNDAVGSGLLDFEKMLEATDNLRTLSLAATIAANNSVYESENINLEKDQKIKIATSWLFNAGITSKKTDNDNSLIYPLSDPDSVFQKQKGKLFSNYDLFLQQQDENGNWVDVQKSNSLGSNVELITYKTDKKGIYRIKILKVEETPFKDSVDDKLSVTFAKFL